MSALFPDWVTPSGVFGFSYLGEQDRGGEEDGEAPDEDETSPAVGHGAE
jgi:hypothetical protein